jgi:hypothetical protein
MDSSSRAGRLTPGKIAIVSIDLGVATPETLADRKR